MNEVWIVQGKNKVRLTTKRGIDLADEVNNSLRATLTKGENLVGSIILANPDGSALPLIETLLAGLNINNSVKVRTRTVACPPNPIEIPGITAANALDANDCFGTLFNFKVPTSGKLVGATFWDYDDEGTQVDLEIFSEQVAQIASDAAWDPTDRTMESFITEMQFYAFDDHVSSQTSEIKSFGKDYVCPSGEFWIQAVTRSTPTIAAGSMPRVQLYILSDDPDFQP